ncbi:hypothetical protein ACU8KH_06655 [Lachancea thermotolerans]
MGTSLLRINYVSNHELLTPDITNYPTAQDSLVEPKRSLAHYQV